FALSGRPKPGNRKPAPERRHGPPQGFACLPAIDVDPPPAPEVKSEMRQVPGKPGVSEQVVLDSPVLRAQAAPAPNPINQSSTNGAEPSIPKVAQDPTAPLAHTAT